MPEATEATEPAPVGTTQPPSADTSSAEPAIDFGSRAFGTRVVILAYLVAGAAALLVGLALSDRGPVAITWWADVAGTVAIFTFSVAFRNSSFYDPYWSVGPIAIALYWIFGPGAEGVDGGRQLLVFALIALWGGRLTFNWWRGWTGLDHEDWRYRNIREKTGVAYWPVSFAGIHFFPTVQVFLGCLAAYSALAVSDAPLGWLDALATVVTAGAIWIEAEADKELVRFRESSPAPGAILDTGVWRTSRHPNYFGEVAFWWGLWLFGLSADPSWWWTVIGPLAITLMFWFVSLPLIENRMLERRPHYAAVIESTSRLVPWPR